MAMANGLPPTSIGSPITWSLPVSMSETVPSVWFVTTSCFPLLAHSAPARLVADGDLLDRPPPLAGPRDHGDRPARRVGDVGLLPRDRDADGLAPHRHLVGLGEIASVLADFEHRDAVGVRVHAEEQAAGLVERDAARTGRGVCRMREAPTTPGRTGRSRGRRRIDQPSGAFPGPPFRSCELRLPGLTLCHLLPAVRPSAFLCVGRSTSRARGYRSSCSHDRSPMRRFAAPIP